MPLKKEGCTMRRQRPYVLVGLVLAAVMLVGAAAQVTREEFDVRCAAQAG